MDSGYIKLFRTITENPMWEDEPFTRAQAWIDILFMTNYHDSSFFVRGVEVFVKRGQFAVSEQVLSKKWNFSRTKLRKFLFWLEKKHQIKQQKNNVLSIYTVTNYDRYNPEKTTEKTTDDTTERQQKDNRKTYTRTYKNTISKDIVERPRSKVSILDDPDVVAGFIKKYPKANVRVEIEKMKNWFLANGKTKKDYVAFARNWFMKAFGDPVGVINDEVFMKADENKVMYKYKLVDGKEVRI
jgi:hypothetical protein